MSITVAKAAAIIATCFIHLENPKICPKEEFPALSGLCKEFIRRYNALPGQGVNGLQEWQQMMPRIQNLYIALQYNLQVNPRRTVAQLRKECKSVEDAR